MLGYMILIIALKLKTAKIPHLRSEFDTGTNSDEEIEWIDLTRPDIDIAPCKPRHPNHLHKNGQMDKKPDKNIRTPKKNHQFSFASGKSHDLASMKGSGLKKEDVPQDLDPFRSLMSDGEHNLPSPSAFFDNGNEMNGHRDLIASSPKAFIQDAPATEPSYLDDSIDTDAASSPRPTSNFATGIFDFASFEDGNKGDDRKAHLLSPPNTRESLKRRKSSSSPSNSPKVKAPRVTQDELTAQSIPKKNTIVDEQSKPVPAWVNELDADLVESLMGIVDFMD